MELDQSILQKAAAVIGAVQMVIALAILAIYNNNNFDTLHDGSGCYGAYKV